MAGDSSKPCRLLFVPEGSATAPKFNSYSRQMVQACERLGLHPVSKKIRSAGDLVRALRQRPRTVALVNWLENQMVDDAGCFSLKGTLKYFERLLKLRLLASVLLYVEHNQYPHNARESSRAITRRVMRCAMRVVADRVLTHGSPSLLRTYLPHPSYPLKPSVWSPQKKSIVCFGSVAPRKGLEEVVDRWSSDYVLLIAGHAGDEAYLRSLQDRSAGKNVAFRTDRSTDEEAADLIAANTAVIVVNNAPSTIVSGSLYFAISCGMPVLAVGLEHARHLAATGTPGVHHVASFDELASVDWAALGRSDRHAIYEHAHRHFGIEAVAGRLSAILEEARN